MEFQSKKALVYHLSSKVHKKQSVYCPWCNTKNIITRVTDLKVHCLSKHFVELDLQPKNFIGGNNCFYFAVYPEVYADIFKPEPWANPMAVEARRLIMNMAERVGMSFQERDKIREGWRKGKEMLENKEEKDIKVRKRTDSENVKEVYETIFTAAPLNLGHPKKKVKFDNEVQISANKDKICDKQLPTSQTDKINTLSSTPDKREKKLDKHKSEQKEQRHHGHIKKQISNRTEKDNDIDNYHMKQSNETNTNVKDINNNVGNEDKGDVQTVITLETGKDGVRRLINLKQKAQEGERLNDTESRRNVRNNEKESDEGANEMMEKDENVEINRVTIEEVRDDNKDTVVNENMKENDDEVMTDDEIENMMDDDDNKDSVVKFNTEKNRDIESENNEIVRTTITEKGDAHDVTESRTSDSEQEDCAMDMNERDMASVWKNWNLEIPNEKAKNVGRGKSSIKLKIKDGQIKRVVEIKKRTETEEAVNQLLEKEFIQEREVHKDKNQITEPEISHEQLKTPKHTKHTYSELAIAILTKGAMPLCPPGRRDWGSVLVPLVIPVGETSFSWPPFGWQNMSADRKLLEWEAASWKLECLINGFVPANMSRRYLLDKYMFLALPGSSGPKVETAEKSCSASRAFTYKMLKELASGERQPTKAEEEHITTLDYLTTLEISHAIALDYLQVPLKLSEDNTA